MLDMSVGCFNRDDLGALFPRLIYKKTLPGDQLPLLSSSTENMLQQLLEIEVGLFFNVIQFLSFKEAAMTFQFIYELARSFNTAQFDAYITDYFKLYLSIDSDKSHPTLYEIISVVEYASDRVRAILFSVLMDEKSCFAVARANELIYSNAVITRRIYLTRLVYGLYLMLGVNLDAEHHYTSVPMVITYLSSLLIFSLDYLKIAGSALPVVRNRFYRKYWVESIPPNATRPVTLRQSRSTNFYTGKAHTETLKILLLNVDPRRRTVLESIRAVQGVSFFTSPHNRSQSRNLAHRTIDVDNSHSSGNDSDLDLSLETPLLQGSMSA